MNGLELVSLSPTHCLLNHELGPFRFLNRMPGLLLAFDRFVVGRRWRPGRRNELLIAHRPA